MIRQSRQANGFCILSEMNFVGGRESQIAKEFQGEKKQRIPYMRIAWGKSEENHENILQFNVEKAEISTLSASIKCTF